jgi:hypothetical protein
MHKRLLAIVCSFLCFSVYSANAGFLSGNNSSSDSALIACIKSHPSAGNSDALGIYIKQCESEIRASLLDCRVAGNTEDVCNWSLLSFMNKVGKQ